MTTTRDGQRKRPAAFDARAQWFGVFILVCLGVLVARLWYMQVMHGDEFAREAEINRLHPLRLKAPRGMIFGRDNVVLADNRGAWDLILVPGECDDPEAVCRTLDSIIDIDIEGVLDKMKKNSALPFEQIVVKQDLSKVDLTRVEEYSSALPGILTVVRPKRRYAQGETAGQIIGYLSEIGEEELEQRKDRYAMADLIGMAGLERRYEDFLRGEDGNMLVNVFATDRRPQIRTSVEGKADIVIDRNGRTLDLEYRIEPRTGKTLQLTLDVPLQAHCEKLLEGQTGAITVLDAGTGEVLALASSPGYDPGAFTTRGRNRERAEYLSDKHKPMRNRCFQEVYPPGSVFKVMLAFAALEEGVIDKDTTFYCPGHFKLGPGTRSWKCWRPQGHGRVAVTDALAFSCDVFFYNVGVKLGVDKIKKWCDLTSLGRPTGIDLPREVSGLIPSPEWKKKLNPKDPSEQKWYPGETVNLAIGQGSAAITPLQTAVMMACVLNDGRRVRPYLVQGQKAELSEAFISKDVLEIVREGMIRCVEKETFPSGTGRLARIEGMKVLGKTGTAQVVGTQHYEHLKEADIPYELRDHAWFVAGVLDREPRIAVSVLVEHGLHGGKGAAPLAKEAITFFYSQPGRRQAPSTVAMTAPAELNATR